MVAVFYLEVPLFETISLFSFADNRKYSSISGILLTFLHWN